MRVASGRREQRREQPSNGEVSAPAAAGFSRNLVRPARGPCLVFPATDMAAIVGVGPKWCVLRYRFHEGVLETPLRPRIPAEAAGSTGPRPRIQT